MIRRWTVNIAPEPIQGDADAAGDGASHCCCSTKWYRRSTKSRDSPPLFAARASALGAYGRN